MGAHTLGKARIDASGYRGPWLIAGTNDFNNGFFQMLQDPAAYWKKVVMLYSQLIAKDYVLQLMLYTGI